MYAAATLTLLFVAVSHGAVTNDDRCMFSHGACHSYVTARDCNTLGFCKNVVWNKPTESAELCTMCKDEITKLQDWVKKKKTKEAVERDLLSFCKAIPFPKVANECQQLVIEGFDDVYDDIIAALDPDVLCTALRLCSAVDAEKTIEKMMKDFPDMAKKALLEGKLPMAAPFALDLPGLEPEDDCSDCEAFMNDFKNTVMNNKKVVGDWMAMLKTECEALGDGLDSLCKENVNTIVHQTMMQLQRNTADVKMACKAMKMCDMFKNKPVGDVCQDCKTFFSDWQMMLKNNKTLVNHIVDVVSQFYCLQKPVDQREQCARYVAMVIKVLLDRVEREDVGEICTKLEFCQAPAPRKPDLKKLAKHVSKVVLQAMPARKLKVKSDQCTDCKSFITDLQNVIMNNKSLVQELVDLVKQECSELGPELEPICVDLIDDKYEELLQQFAEADVDTICTTIMMCTGVSQKSTAGDLCSDCEAFFGDWQNIIANNKSVINQRLKQVKEQVCETVPALIRFECDKTFDEITNNLMDAIVEHCDTVVKEYLPQLWDLIAETDPSEICATLYFCDAVKVRSTPHKRIQDVTRHATQMTKAVGGDVECQTCQFIINEVEKLVQGNATAEDIVPILQEVCNLYSADIRDECKQYMKDHTAEIIDFLILEVNTIELCSKIGLCKNGDKFWMKKPKKVGIPVACGLCKLVVGYIDKKVDTNRTRENIEKELEKVCNIVPAKDKDECVRFVEKYGKDVVDLLLVIVGNPSLVCAGLGLCSPLDKATVELPAQVEAKFSPAADTKVNAIECDLCRDIVRECDRFLVKNKTQAEIIHELHAFCNDLPTKVQSDCNEFVDEYAPTIIALLVQETTPDTVCGLIGFCSSKKESVKSDIECDLCKDVIKQLESLIDSNSTEKEIVAALEKVCSLLPANDQKACNDLIDQYGPTILELLLEEFTPDSVCGLLKLCTSAVVKESVESDIECDLCKDVMKQLESLIDSNSTEKEILTALEEVCSLLPANDQKACNDLIEQYGPAILQVLLEEFTPDTVCNLLKLCTSPVVKTEVKSISGCKLCRQISAELEKQLNKQSTEDEILSAIENVCSLLPEQDQESCKKLIEQHGRAIFDFLREEFAPGGICMQLRICPGKNLKTEVKSRAACELCQDMSAELEKLVSDPTDEAQILAAIEKVCTLMPQSKRQTCDDMVEKYGKAMFDFLKSEFAPGMLCQQLGICPGKELKVSSEVSCDVCEFVAGQLEGLLEKNATATEIEKALEEVCQLIPSSMKTECDTLIKQYGETIIELLVEEMNPSKICTAIKLCSSPVASNKVSSELTCEICRTVADQLQTMLKDNTTEDEIIVALVEVCGMIPSFKDECNSLVKEYGDQLIQLLIEETDPSKLCVELKQCDSVAVAMKSRVKSNAECPLCEMIMTELQKLLNEQSTEKEIERAVEKVCGLLPQEYAGVCRQYIEDYGPGVISILVQDFVPDQICTTLGVCRRKGHGMVNKLRVAGPSEKCTVCKEVITVLDNILKDNATEEDLLKTLETICNYMPGQLVKQCDGFVEEYGKELFQYIDELGQPNFVCEKLKLCPTTPQKQQNLVGVNPCTYGPSYWCSTMDKAKECNAVEHCRNHVWD